MPPFSLPGGEGGDKVTREVDPEGILDKRREVLKGAISIDTDEPVPRLDPVFPGTGPSEIVRKGDWQ